MTSSLVGTIAVSFTIPLAVSFDVFFKQVQYPRLFFLGTIPMFVSFVTIILVSQYDQWDPILGFLERCVRLVKVGSIPSTSSSPGESDRDSLAFSGSGDRETSCAHATNLLMENEHHNDNLQQGEKIVNRNEIRILDSGNDSPPITPVANNRRFEGNNRSHPTVTSSLPANSLKKLITESTVPSLSSSTAKLYNFDSGSDDDQDEDDELSKSLIQADGGGVFA